MVVVLWFDGPQPPGPPGVSGRKKKATKWFIISFHPPFGDAAYENEIPPNNDDDITLLIPVLSVVKLRACLGVHPSLQNKAQIDFKHYDKEHSSENSSQINIPHFNVLY